jgi:hypothetical protein
MAETLADLERLLGPPSEFILSQRTIQPLRRWAIAIGVAPVEVYAMSNIELSNLYHERGEEIKSDASELRRIAADLLLKLTATVQSNKVDPELLRSIVRDEIEHLPTRKIEILGLQSNIILDGPLHYSTERVIQICAINHPIMMVGPAGCGKTTIGNHAARALNLPFYITSTVTETHQLTGFIDGHGVYHRTPFRDAFEYGGLWVPDEIDAWDAAALLVANSALANGYSVFPDSPAPIARHPNFRMVATANTFGHGADRVYVGRNELDAASLDRFATINVDYDLTLERLLCNSNVEWLEYVWKIRKEVTEHKIRHVVSTRAIIMGSAALQVGIPRDEVEEIYLFKGMSKKDRDKIDA